MVEGLAITLHQTVKRLFSRVSKRRMAHIMDESESFRKVLIEFQHVCNSAGDLRDFDGMRQPVAEMVGKRGSEDLRLVLEPPESARVNDPVVIALKCGPVRVIRLRVSPATRRLDREPEMAEHE